MGYSRVIPYSRQCIDDDDIQSVVDVLKSDWLTTGPMVDRFERSFEDYVGVKHAVAVSSGTAALHAAMYTIGIGPGDEVILPPMTFAATANAVVYQQGIPVFCDVNADTLLINPDLIEEKITSRTKAIVTVDYAGQPCDYDTLREIADRHGLIVIADACHALGATYKGYRVGSLADLNVFSFHPVKHITTGEGGMITTDNSEYAERMRMFRNHGISTDHRQRADKGSWFYEMIDLGYNYRITDFQCALGLNQLKKLPHWLERRREIAMMYNEALAKLPEIVPLEVDHNVVHAYHLYVVRITPSKNRDAVFIKLREYGIGVNVHYIPVYFHPFYRIRLGVKRGICPVAEDQYKKILSLPIYQGLTDDSVSIVIQNVFKIISNSNGI